MPSENDFSIPSPSGASLRSSRDGSGQKWSALVMLALGAGLGVAEAGDAEAQDGTDTGTTATDSTINLSAVRVHGQVDADSSNTNNTSLDIGRMPGTVRDTPQTISVVPKELIIQQRLFTLDQACGGF